MEEYNTLVYRIRKWTYTKEDATYEGKLAFYEELEETGEDSPNNDISKSYRTFGRNLVKLAKKTT